MYFWLGRIGQLLARSGTTLRRSHVPPTSDNGQVSASPFSDRNSSLLVLSKRPTSDHSSPPPYLQSDSKRRCTVSLSLFAPPKSGPRAAPCHPGIMLIGSWELPQHHPSIDASIPGSRLDPPQNSTRNDRMHLLADSSFHALRLESQLLLIGCSYNSLFFKTQRNTAVD
ncbi:uncharacterized protein BDV17DRAFT_99512 [Aspergillus undulatus]|uniref:uncharacterized protein n=1 Tax=Aspergillus undulatus TaxID=1810928 RepID=UPI003CCC9DCE